MNVRIAGIERHSAVNGPGVRYVLFFQGCPHHCKGCQNPETWDFSKGEERDIKELLDDIASTKYLDGVTLSGGDPLAQGKAAKEIIDGCKARGMDVWCYTGWTFEEILEGKAGEEARQAIENLDVLVDGRFSLALLSQNVLFRGSSNQRLVDVKRSLREGKVVEKTGFDFGL